MNYTIKIKRKFWFAKEIRAKQHLIESIGKTDRLIIVDYQDNTHSFNLEKITYTVSSDYVRAKEELEREKQEAFEEQQAIQREQEKEHFIAEALKKAKMWDNLQAQNNVQPIQKKHM